jgi:hypothetical protein
MVSVGASVGREGEGRPTDPDFPTKLTGSETRVGCGPGDFSMLDVKFCRNGAQQIAPRKARNE